MVDSLPFAQLSWGALLAGWGRSAVPLDALVTRALQVIDQVSPAELMPLSELLMLNRNASDGNVEDILVQLAQHEHLPPGLARREWTVAELAALLTTLVSQGDDPYGSQVVFELTQFWATHDHPADVPLVQYLFLVDQEDGAAQRDYVVGEHGRWVEREQRVVDTLMRLWHEGNRAAVQTLLEAGVWAQTYARQRFERSDMERRALERMLRERGFNAVLADTERMNSHLFAELQRERQARESTVGGT